MERTVDVGTWRTMWCVLYLYLAVAQVMKHVAAPHLGALLQRDVGLVTKTAILSPHAPRPCLLVEPCLGNVWPRVLPFTTMHDDGLLGGLPWVRQGKKKKTTVENVKTVETCGSENVKTWKFCTTFSSVLLLDQKDQAPPPVHGPPRLGTWERPT